MFWIAFGLSLGLGTMTALLKGGPLDVGAAAHDVVAYTLLASVTCFCLLDPLYRQRLHRVAWLVAAFGSLLLAVQVAEGALGVTITDAEPWYWDRFRGWSQNPNQLALLCALLMPLGLYLAESEIHWTSKALGLALAIIPAIAGRMTKSDTFLLSAISVFGVILGHKAFTLLTTRGRRPSFSSLATIMCVLTLPLLMLSAAPLAASMANGVENVAKSLTKGKGGEETEETASLRFHLWQQALSLGLESGMLGLGPGPHLERPPTVSDVDVGEDPNEERDPSQKFEAHNTALDLLTQGGALAVLAFTALLIGALLAALRFGHGALAGMLCVVAVFGMTHLIVRHPMVWFALILPYSVSRSTKSYTLSQDRR